jgi:hypothetical protein
VLGTWSDFATEHTHGNSYDFGKYDECRSLEFKTQYCLIQYHYKPTSDHKVIAVQPNKSFYNFGWKNINKRFGGAICLPESCTVEDIEEILEQVLKESDYMQANYYDQKEYCQKSSRSRKIDPMSIFSL